MLFAGAKGDVLRQQQPRLNSDFPTNGDNSVDLKDTVLVHVPPTKSAFRLHNRFVLLLSDKINHTFEALTSQLLYIGLVANWHRGLWQERLVIRSSH